MKNIFLLIAFQLIIFSCQAQKWNKYSILFGEKSLEMETPSENVVQVFIDQDGFYYPDYFIKDKKLKRSKSSLAEYLRKNSTVLDTLCKRHNIDQGLDADNKLVMLKLAIAKVKVNEINSLIDDYDAVFISIHGFRKQAYGKKYRLSVTDNNYLEHQIDKNNKKNLYVEIYWDSKYITPFQGYKYKGFRMMEEAAIPNAQRVGSSLRLLLPEIEKDTINIVAHSLGSIVTAEILFSKDEDSLATPSQKRVNVCLMAPAIGSEYFEDYYKRSTNINYEKEDNYHLVVIHNKNDFALNKNFKWRGIGVILEPTEYGNTSLGCDYHKDTDVLLKLFKEEYSTSPTPKLVDIHEYNDGTPMGCHYIRCYTANQKFHDIEMFQ